MNDDEEQILDGPLESRYDISTMKASQITRTRAKYNTYYVVGGKIRTAAGQELAFNLRPKESKVWDWHADGKVSVATVACKVCSQINTLRPPGTPPFVCLVPARPRSLKSDGSVICLHCRIRYNRCSAKGGLPPKDNDSTSGIRASNGSARKAKRADHDNREGSTSLSEPSDSDDSDESEEDLQYEYDRFSSKRSRQESGNVNSGLKKRQQEDAAKEGHKLEPQTTSSLSNGKGAAPRHSEPSRPPPPRPGSDTLSFRRPSTGFSSNLEKGKKIQRRCTDIPSSTRPSNLSQEEAIVVGSSEEEETSLSRSKEVSKKLNGEGSASSTGMQTNGNDHSAAHLTGPILPLKIKERIKMLTKENESLQDKIHFLRMRLKERRRELEQAREENSEKSRAIEKLEEEIVTMQKLMASTSQAEKCRNTREVTKERSQNGLDDVHMDASTHASKGEVPVSQAQIISTVPSTLSTQGNGIASQDDASLGAMKRKYDELKARDKELDAERVRLEALLSEVQDAKKRLEPDLEQGRVKLYSMLQAELMKLE